jgi:hypothetical protein
MLNQGGFIDEQLHELVKAMRSNVPVKLAFNNQEQLKFSRKGGFSN